MKKWIVCFLFVFLLVGCTSTKERESYKEALETKSVINVHCLDLSSVLNENTYLLVTTVFCNDDTIKNENLRLEIEMDSSVKYLEDASKDDRYTKDLFPATDSSIYYYHIVEAEDIQLSYFKNWKYIIDYQGEKVEGYVGVVIDLDENTYLD